MKKQLKRRSAIEPHIGHMKEDGKLRRNHLKGAEGDRMNAILCGIGHNLRMILRRIRILFVQILEAFCLVIRTSVFYPFNINAYKAVFGVGYKLLGIKLMAA